MKFGEVTDKSVGTRFIGPPCTSEGTYESVYLREAWRNSCTRNNLIIQLHILQSLHITSVRSRVTLSAIELPTIQCSPYMSP